MGYGGRLEGREPLRTNKFPVWLRPIWVDFSISCNQKTHICHPIYNMLNMGISLYLYLHIYAHMCTLMYIYERYIVTFIYTCGLI